MAITEAFAGTQSVGTTEHSLTTDAGGVAVETSDGVFQLWLDLNALAIGDIFQLRLYEKVQAGDTQRVAEEWILAGPMGKPNFVTPTFILMHGWDFTLDKLVGTDRTITWSIRKVA